MKPSHPITTRALSRREMLRLGAGSLLALGLWPGALRAADAGGENFSFIAVNDLHYVDEKCGEWLQTVVAKMKACAPKPDLCLCAGDFTDDGTVAQLTAARDLLKGLGCPLYGVIGNHDWARGPDRKAYEEVFPDRLNYTFEHRGWQVVALDTTENLKASRTRIADATFKWVDDHLPGLDKRRPMLLVSHFPLGPGVTNRPLNADELLERFKAHNLRAALCGHFHGFTEKQIGETILTTGKCCSLKKNNHDRTKEKGFFFCQTKDGQLQREFIEVPLPQA